MRKIILGGTLLFIGIGLVGCGEPMEKIKPIPLIQEETVKEEASETGLMAPVERARNVKKDIEASVTDRMKEYGIE